MQVYIFTITETEWQDDLFDKALLIADQHDMEQSFQRRAMSLPFIIDRLVMTHFYIALSP